MTGRGRRWRNVPLPEAHVVGLLASGGLQAWRPWPLATDHPGAVLGGSLVGLGLVVVAWAVVAVGRQAVGSPTDLVTGGPYRYSRNPMYVGWTAIYVGVGLLSGVAWVAALLPLVVVAVHVTVRREERRLERRFGADYRDYVREVRRYV